MSKEPLLDSQHSDIESKKAFSLPEVISQQQAYFLLRRVLRRWPSKSEFQQAAQISREDSEGYSWRTEKLLLWVLEKFPETRDESD